MAVQLFSMYYLLYKEMTTLASVSFFKRSGTYNLYSFGKVGYKNDVKTAKKIWEHMFFMQASDYVIIYLNKNKFFVALFTICDTCLIIIISLFQEDNIFGTNASLTYGPRLQR